MFKHMPRYEKIWLSLGGLSLIAFLIILGVMAFGLGLQAPGHMHTIVPEEALKTAPFDDLGLKQTGEHEYELIMSGQMFAFFPNEVIIPAGSTVHFKITSPDVVHGLLIPGTNVNMMIVPGHITEFTYTFRESGEFLMLCNEYCGAGHHVMMAKLTVQA